MTNADVLLALAERVEAGESGREIEREIASALGWQHRSSVLAVWWLDPAGNLASVPEWTRSLDAIEALRVAKLPGWRVVAVVEWFQIVGDGHEWACHLACSEGSQRPQGVRGAAPTEPAARLAAVLRALAATKETDNAE